MPLEQVHEDERGNRIYREPNGAGGQTYWSDSIGGGVIIFDSCLATVKQIETVIAIHKRDFPNG